MEENMVYLYGDMPSPFPPKKSWTHTMRRIHGLASEPVFKALDVRQAASLNEGQFQAWFRRDWEILKDPAEGGSGHHRQFTLMDVTAIAAGVDIGGGRLGRELEKALELGYRLSHHCVYRWMQQGQMLDEAGKVDESAPRVALRNLAAFTTSGLVESLDLLTVAGDQTREIDPHASLADVWAGLRDPVFSVIDMRTVRVKHFFPAAARLLERMTVEASEVKALEDLYVKA